METWGCDSSEAHLLTMNPAGRYCDDNDEEDCSIHGESHLNKKRPALDACAALSAAGQRVASHRWCFYQSYLKRWIE